MDFLDSLENSLKNLEQQDERSSDALLRQQEARKLAQNAAPWAEKLKSSRYTKTLLDKATVAGHHLRSKMYMAWLDTTLRLEVRGRWCELRPTAEGIVAEFIDPNQQTRSEAIDLKSRPEELLSHWLGNEIGLS